MPQGFALTSASSVEIVAAYAAPLTTIQAVASTPGWIVLGAFYLPKSCDARLDAMMVVSDSSLTCRVRLYDVTVDSSLGAAARVIPGGVSTSSETIVRQLGGVVALKAGHIYQIQAEVTGNSGDAYFGVVPTATITN